MGQEVNVVYRTSKPRYVVERRYPTTSWSAVRPDAGEDDQWERDRGFASLANAQECADEQQSLFPDAEFRVVDTQP